MIQYRRLEKHELTPELFQDFIRHQTVTVKERAGG